MLKASISLQTLDISDNSFTGSDGSKVAIEIRPIASALKTNMSITELDLLNNNLDTDTSGLIALAEALLKWWV